MSQLKFQPKCLACGSNLDTVEALGLAMEGGQLTCSSCGEHHNYRILGNRLTMKRTSVPRGFVGSTEDTLSPLTDSVSKPSAEGQDVKAESSAVEKPCTRCKGSGTVRASCTKCGGRGRVIPPWGRNLPRELAETTCPNCMGSGTAGTQTCPRCNGSRKEPPEERQATRISRTSQERKWWQFWK
jgi:RecJ-like exonuclease